MDANLKAKWVEALRSGEFKQSRLSLKDRHGYCCIGVLCKVAGLSLEGHNRVAGSAQEDGYSPIYSLVDSAAISELVSMNDKDKKPFSEIADYIEANL